MPQAAVQEAVQQNEKELLRTAAYARLSVENGGHDPAVQEAVKAVAEALGDTGRILVRESGTEPVVRVMVEAPDHDTCQKYVSQVVEVIKSKGCAV